MFLDDLIKKNNLTRHLLAVGAVMPETMVNDLCDGAVSIGDCPAKYVREMAKILDVTMDSLTEQGLAEAALIESYETEGPDYLASALNIYKKGLAAGSDMLDSHWNELYECIDRAAFRDRVITKENADYLRTRYIYGKGAPVNGRHYKEKASRKILFTGKSDDFAKIIDNCTYYLGKDASEKAVLTGEGDFKEFEKDFPFVWEKDILSALKATDPTLILCSGFSGNAADIISESLLPYYRECADSGRPQPALIIFSNEAELKECHRILGESVPVVLAYANPYPRVDGQLCPGLGVNILISEDPEALPSEALKEIEDFFYPTGLPAVISPEKINAALTVVLSTYLLSLYADTVSEQWKRAGSEYSFVNVASVIWDASKKNWRVHHPIGEDLPYLISDAVLTSPPGDATRGFKEGMKKFLTEMGFDNDSASDMICLLAQQTAYRLAKECGDEMTYKYFAEKTDPQLLELLKQKFEEHHKFSLAGDAYSAAEWGQYAFIEEEMTQGHSYRAAEAVFAELNK